MIEKIILDALTEMLDVPVHMEIPERAPARFVVIEKTGSGCEDLLYESTFAFQSYAGCLLEAAALNEEVKTAAFRLPERKEISAARLNSDYNFTDTASKRYRYQAVFDIYHY